MNSHSLRAPEVSERAHLLRNVSSQGSPRKVFALKAARFRESRPADTRRARQSQRPAGRSNPSDKRSQKQTRKLKLTYINLFVSMKTHTHTPLDTYVSVRKSDMREFVTISNQQVSEHLSFAVQIETNSSRAQLPSSRRAEIEGNEQ